VTGNHIVVYGGSDKVLDYDKLYLLN